MTEPPVNMDPQMRIGALRDAVIGVFAQACCLALTVREVVDAVVDSGFDYEIFPGCRSVVIDPVKLDRRHMLTKRRLNELTADGLLAVDTLSDGELVWKVVPGAIDQLPPVDPDHVCPDKGDKPDPKRGVPTDEPDPQQAPVTERMIDTRRPLRPLRDVRADIAAVAMPVVSAEAVAALAAHRAAASRRRRLAVFVVLALATVTLLVAAVLTA